MVWVFFLCVYWAKERYFEGDRETHFSIRCLPIIFFLSILFDLTFQMFIRVKWFCNLGSCCTSLPRVLHSLAGRWVSVTLWNGILNREKGRGRREKETLWLINNSCSADDLWIAVVNRLLWLLNQLYYMPVRKKKMTNDSVVGAISIQLVVASSRLMNEKLDSVMIFVWNAFHFCWRGEYCKWCTIRHQNPLLLPQ